MVLLIFECAVLNAVSQKVMDMNTITTCLVSFVTVHHNAFLYWQASIVVFRQCLVLFDLYLGAKNIPSVCSVTYMYTKVHIKHIKCWRFMLLK